MAIDFLFLLALAISACFVADVLLDDQQKTTVVLFATRIWNAVDIVRRYVRRFCLVTLGPITGANDARSRIIPYSESPHFLTAEVMELLHCTVVATAMVVTLSVKCYESWNLFLELWNAGDKPPLVVMKEIGEAFVLITMAIVLALAGTSLVVFLAVWPLYLFAVALACTEYVLRRIVEYPKGPLVAASIIAASIFGLLKAMR